MFKAFPKCSPNLLTAETRSSQRLYRGSPRSLPLCGKKTIIYANPPSAMVVCTRIIGEKQTNHVRFYISSLPSDAKRILEVVRKHWAIENELHWLLDVALNEDHSRVRKDQALENFAVLRHIALNLLKQEKTAKGGIHAKQFQAALKEDYLLKVLTMEFRYDCLKTQVNLTINFHRILPDPGYSKAIAYKLNLSQPVISVF